MDYFTDKRGNDELECKCGCGVTVDEVFRIKLNVARHTAGVPFRITSGARCVAHNKHVGGSVTSSHVKGIAADIAFVDNTHLAVLVHNLTKAGFTRFGVNTKRLFIHIDTDSNKPDAIWSY